MMPAGKQTGAPPKSGSSRAGLPLLLQRLRSRTQFLVPVPLRVQPRSDLVDHHLSARARTRQSSSGLAARVTSTKSWLLLSEILHARQMSHYNP